MRKQLQELPDLPCGGCQGKGWIEDKIETTKKCIICDGNGIVPSGPPGSEPTLRLPFFGQGDYGRFVVLAMVLILGFFAVTFLTSLMSYENADAVELPIKIPAPR